MAGTDMEINRPLKLAKVDPSDSALAQAQALYRDPRGTFAGLSEDARLNLTIGTGALFIISTALGLGTLAAGIVFPTFLIAIAPLGATLGWANIPFLSWQHRMNRSKREVSQLIWDTRDALNSWLLDTYGLQFQNIMDSEHLAERLLKLGQPIDPQEEFTMHTLGGMRIQARFELNGDGFLEIKKTQATDPNESPYFTPLREELS